MQPESRIPAIDVIKAVAILAVITRHAGPHQWHPEFSELDAWIRSTWVQFHVPSFLMMTGFLMARESMDWRTTLARLQRVLVPYAIACAVVHLTGNNAKVDGWEDVLYRLATGSSLGIYYYVFLHVACTLLMWPLSRLPSQALLLVWVGLLLYAELAVLYPAYRATHVPFLALRDPSNFYLAYFLAGWLARLHWASVGAFLRGRGVGWWSLCAAVAVVALAAEPLFDSTLLRRMLRPVYTFAVVGLLASIPWPQRPPGSVLWLSQCTLGIYLFHVLFIRAALPFVLGWPPLPRFAAAMAAALAGSVALGWLARRLLGRERARDLLGF